MRPATALLACVALAGVCLAIDASGGKQQTLTGDNSQLGAGKRGDPEAEAIQELSDAKAWELVAHALPGRHDVDNGSLEVSDNACLLLTALTVEALARLKAGAPRNATTWNATVVAPMRAACVREVLALEAKGKATKSIHGRYTRACHELSSALLLTRAEKAPKAAVVAANATASVSASASPKALAATATAAGNATTKGKARKGPRADLVKAIAAYLAAKGASAKNVAEVRRALRYVNAGRSASSPSAVDDIVDEYVHYFPDIYVQPCKSR